MEFTIEKSKTGKPFIIYNNVKYRQQRVLRNGTVYWSCLGKTCCATVKTDSDNTSVKVCNEKHSGEHPVTMRKLCSPLTQPSPSSRFQPSSPAVTPALTPLSTTATLHDTLSPPPTHQSPSATPSAYSTPCLVDTGFAKPGGSTTTNLPEEATEEIQNLKQEINRLKKEYAGLLDHTIESDTRLLQFTDQIFTSSNASCHSQADSQPPPVMIDVGVQSDQTPPSSATSPTERILVNSGVQCDTPILHQTLMSQREDKALIHSLKTTIEVLEAENKYLLTELENYKHGRISEQPWSTVGKKTKHKNNNINKSVPLFHRHTHTLDRNKSSLATERSNLKQPQSTVKRIINKGNNRLHNVSSKPTTVKTRSIVIRGDSHSRHIAELVKEQSTASSVFGICKPGARLMNIMGGNPPSSINNCEVFIAGTNDVASGDSRDIYRCLEGYITDRLNGTRLILATLPYRYDLPPDHNIHYDTSRVNAYIEQLALRHNIDLLRMDVIGRKYFTRHGQHLSKRGKRLLAGMITRIVANSDRPSSGRRSRNPAKVIPQDAPLRHGTLRVTPAAGGESASRPESATLGHHLDSYAQAVSGAPYITDANVNGRSQIVKNMVTQSCSVIK